MGVIKALAAKINACFSRQRAWAGKNYCYFRCGTPSTIWQLEQIRMSAGNLSLQRIESVIPVKNSEQRKAFFVDSLYKAGLK